MQKLTTKKLDDYIRKNTIRCEVSYRGGGIEIDASEYLDIEDARISAYQNYLGGGIAGAIQSSNSMRGTHLRPAQVIKLETLQEALKKYFFSINNGGGDEYMQDTASYERTQSLPASAY